jgi:hypothetical protein
MADEPTKGREFRSAPATAEPLAPPKPRPATREEPPPHATKTMPIPVNVKNFIRAETDMYFSRAAFGELTHYREMVPIDKQTVVRMNRDTLYSSGVFDLDAGPVTITLPDSGKRFRSMMLLSEDHFAFDVVYDAGRYTYTRDQTGTRYLLVAIRTFASPSDAADLNAAHALQDATRVEQARKGKLELPTWDLESQARVRDALVALGHTGIESTRMFGAKNEVEPVAHLVGTAVGWGGNPNRAAIYQGSVPKANDGQTIHTLTVRDVPVDGFWSVSVYNEQGYFEPNAFNAYSVNNVTARPNADGSVTVQFGGCEKGTTNCLPISPRWNYTVRLYRPRKEVVDGTWKFPEATPR